MSFHSRQKLAGIQDEVLLLRALGHLGHTIEQNTEAVSVRGYGNELIATRCRLVLRRESANLRADIGFHQEQDGSFVLISDSFANKNLQEFASTLKRTYEEERAIARASQLGYTNVQRRGEWIQRDGKKYLQLVISQ
jgi:hypothetical protein